MTQNREKSRKNIKQKCEMKKLTQLLCIALLALTAYTANAQAPVPSTTPQPVRPQLTVEQQAERTKLMLERLRTDWANLKKYEAQNEKILSAGPKTNSPIYMGDSITEFWWRADSAFWKDNSYIDRGISGQTTPQMLVRFRPDVVDLHPPLVLINAGVNDISENTGPITLENIFGNIVSMAEIAKVNGIKVVLTSVLPTSYIGSKPDIKPAEKVIRLNGMIKDYATKNHITYVDYWTALRDNVDGLDPKYTRDGLHPNLDGYKIMEPLAKKGIDEALKRK